MQGIKREAEHMILADKIIDLRKKNGWSQEELAAQLGVSRQAVSKWESTSSIPDLDKIIKLSEIFWGEHGLSAPGFHGKGRAGGGCG